MLLRFVTFSFFLGLIATSLTLVASTCWVQKLPVHGLALESDEFMAVSHRPGSCKDIVKICQKGDRNTAENIEEESKERATGASNCLCVRDRFSNFPDFPSGGSSSDPPGSGKHRNPSVSSAAGAGHVLQPPTGSISLKRHGCRHRLNAWCGTGGDIPENLILGAQALSPNHCERL